MAPIDSLLNLVDRQGANELRLGSDREPQMFASGAQKRLVIPRTSTETLRELLGEILSKEREMMLVATGVLELGYEPPGLGSFRVKLTRRRTESAALELDVIFLRGAMPAAAPAPAITSPAITSPAITSPAITAPRRPAPTPLPAPAVDAPPSTTADVPAELVALLQQARSLGASDLHLGDDEPAFVRLDGKLRPLPTARPIRVDAILGPHLLAEARARTDHGTSADLALGLHGLGRFRLNVFRTAGGLALAVRLLAAEAPRLASLHAPVPLDDLHELPNGLVIVCGPTGCGKSTTLAAIAHEALLRRPSLLITLEDPIEHILAPNGAKGVARQRQIGRDVRDFATGLRDALREDPDVLLVGEMRDAESISLALTAAETGHLVLASLHSRSAASAIERIIDAMPKERQPQLRVQLADSLKVVIAQRLLPRANGEGRVLAMEVLRVNPAIASAIREAKIGTITSVIQSNKREGMLPLERCLSDLVQRRQITVEAARAAANDPTALAAYLGV